ncbi:MAG: CHASE2 domain-containing protein [Pseudomonadota bacterium]
MQKIQNTNQAVNIRIAFVGAVFIGLTLISIVSFTDQYDWIKAPDAWLYDWRTAHFASRTETVRQDILVVTIDETSLEQYSWNSPVNRRLTAELVRGLESAGAKAIGLDFLYDKQTKPADDKELIRTLKLAKIPVVIAALDERSTLRERDPKTALEFQEKFIARTSQPAGHAYFFSSEREGRFDIGDNVIRKRTGPSPQPPYRKSFAGLLAEKAAGVSNRQVIAETELIDWQRAPRRGLYRYPVPELRVHAHVPGTNIDGLFRQGWRDLVPGRIVLIGGSFGDRDRHLTPFSVINRQTMPGVFIHAQVLAQLIDGRKVRIIPLWLEGILLVLSVLFGWWLARRCMMPFRKLSFFRYRFNANGIGESFLAGGVIFVAGVTTYAITGYIIPSATIFLAFLAGLSLGNPPHWLMIILKFLRMRGS